MQVLSGFHNNLMLVDFTQRLKSIHFKIKFCLKILLTVNAYLFLCPNTVK